jgi:hypothetical protein
MNKRTGKMTPKQCIARWQFLKGERSTWESHWRELADYILPNRNDINTTVTPGTKRNVTLLDNTAMQANELLAGALHGLLTNPNAQWFELTTGDEELDNSDNVRGWLQKVTTQLHNILNNSNFQTEVHQLYMDETCFGTAAMSIEEDEDMIVRFGSRHIKEVNVAENSKGVIDELYVNWDWNARQIVEEFGEANVPQKILDAYEKSLDQKFCILQAIYPRNLVNYSISPKRMKYASQYILVSEQFELKESGFREFPYVVPRWTKASGETYGRSPGMNALPDAKTLNKMTETVLIGAQKTVDPPLQMPDDGFIMPIITKPGGFNYYRAGSTDRIEPVFNDARVDFGFEAMKERRTRIREAFYVDQLQLSTGPQMTATEVMQRTEERTRLLGPMLGRQQSEFLRPMIDRVWDICERRGLIKDIPEELRGKVIDVQYSSLIAKSQRVSEGQNILRTIQAVTPFLQLDPNVKDLINGDEALKLIARIYSFPQKALNDKATVEKMRSQRAEAQQAALDAQQKAQEAENANKLAPAIAQVQAAG